MNHAILAATLTLATLTLASSLSAQAIEIPAMTVTTSVLNMGAVLPTNPASTAPPAITTTLGALITAGTNGGAPLVAVTLTPSTAQPGLYNTNTTGGRALALDGGNLRLINPVTLVPETVPLATFAAFNATFDLSVPGTEFGVAIGDWLGSMIIEFRQRSNNALIASITSSPYATADAKFFRSPAPFDRVVLRADNPDGNWVIPQLHFETDSPWDSLGQGCAGSNGTPTLAFVAPARIGTTFSLSITNMRAAGGSVLVLLGLSTTSASFGPLPFALDSFGAPGCSIYCDLFGYSVLLHTNGSAQYNQPIPNSVPLIGLQFANQAVATDTVNAMGLVVSNAGVATVR